MYLVASGHSFPGSRVLLFHLEVLSPASLAEYDEVELWHGTAL